MHMNSQPFLFKEYSIQNLDRLSLLLCFQGLSYAVRVAWYSLQVAFVKGLWDTLSDFSRTDADQFESRHMTLGDLQHVFSLVSHTMAKTLNPKLTNAVVTLCL